MKKSILVIGALLLTGSPVAASTTDYDARLQALETTVQQLISKLSDKDQQIINLQQQLGSIKLPGQLSQADLGHKTESPSLSADEVKDIVLAVTSEQQAASPLAKFNFGGYGEIHANINEGSDDDGFSNDQIDIHRLVAYVGYEFADWIKFNSEIEIEHAMVSSGDSGELEVEQAYFDFLLNDYANIRAGRMLIPVGHLNTHHEPTLFNGVERPNFYKYIIPTTWWSDGAGLFGSFGEISYQALVIGGVDGSEFADAGIRGSRIKERPSLNDPAYTVRFDYTPIASKDMQLRLGTSLYYSGLDNGNKGKDPGVDGDLTIYEADFNATIHDFDFTGAVAFEKIDEAKSLGNNVAEEIFGYYFETAYHFWPDQWKKGKLAKSDAIVFVRYDEYDTQYDMPSGVQRDANLDRHDWTMGLTFKPINNIAIKADYQIRKSAGDTDPDNTINLGIGWRF